jgi:hypothetical protein
LKSSAGQRKLRFMVEWHLKIGRKRTGLIVRQDDEYPKLYRIYYRGEISDLMNLSRAKDAARSWVLPYMRPSGGGLPRGHVDHWNRAQSAQNAADALAGPAGYLVAPKI